MNKALRLLIPIEVKRIFRYLKGQPTLGLWYPKDSPLELIAYSDSDYAGASLDRKSTTGGCQFLGCRLISWQCKKQTIVAISTTKAEYIAASNCCGQFWNTATSKIVNSVKQIHAIVDGKAVVISKSSVRSDILFDDEDGITCLTNDEIFENLALMGYKQLSTKLTFQKVSTATIRVSVASAPVTTARVTISTVEPRTHPTTTTVFDDDEDLTIAQTLVKIKSEKAKEKGVAFRDEEEPPRLNRSTTTLQPLPTM
nr:uncharacterized mitochondrial protein AtMg00810-like [Tanacetum cinerariifolium]